MKPGILSILWTDWPALLCLMCLPVIWLISGQLVLFRHDGGFTGSDALMVAVPLSLLAGALLAWRIARIQRLFSRGQLVRPQLTRDGVARGRGRLRFASEFGGLRLHSCALGHKKR